MYGADLERNLDSIGFRMDCIVEVVLVTVNPDGSFNPAPMGLTRVGGTSVELKPFKATATYRNLSRDPQSAANLTHNPTVFLQAAFKDEASMVPEVDEFKIKGCDACVRLEVKEGMEVSADRFRFINDVVGVEVQRHAPRVFSRGVAEAITAIIHATRVKAFSEQGKEAKAGECMEKMRECFKVIARVASPESPEATVVNELNRITEKWSVTA